MSNANHIPSDEPLLETDSFAAELFWERHRGSILAGVAVLLLAVAGTVFWLITAHNLKLGAEAFFANARNPEAWREVIAKYPGTPQAADA